MDKWWGNRKELATVRTICSHVQNMIKGVVLVRLVNFSDIGTVCHCKYLRHHQTAIINSVPSLYGRISIFCSHDFYCGHTAVKLVIVGRTIYSLPFYSPAHCPSCFCLNAGFPVQNAFCVRPFPHQHRHSGEWNSGGDQELPGREVHPPCPNEGR